MLGMLGSDNIRPVPLHEGAWSFAISPKSEYAEYAAAHIVSVYAKSYDSSCGMGYAVLTPPLPPARVVHMVSPLVLLASKFARKALATSKGDIQAHWLGGRLCFGVGLGRGVAEGAITTQ